MGARSLRRPLCFARTRVLGDESFLQSALEFCDVLVQAQELAGGYWARTYILNATGEMTIPGKYFTGRIVPGRDPIIRSPWLSAEERTCRIQDHYQYLPFSLLIWAYRLTGEAIYFETARDVADTVLSLQNENGSWPDEWDFDRRANQFWQSNTRGVRVGGSFNDSATSDAMRMMILMYKITGDPKYVERVPRIGQWLFDTRLGKKGVVGWCQQYGLDNQPLVARSQEMAAIEIHSFTDFVAPLLAWFYALTGESRYRDLFRQAYHWTKSVQKPEGWAYQYLPDGTPVFSTLFDLYRHRRARDLADAQPAG